MKIFLSIIPLLLLASVLSAAPAPPQASDDLKLSLADEFETDSRSEYTLGGMVLWRQGSLTLMPEGSVSRPLNAGSRARVSFEADFPELTRDQQTCSLHVRFDLAGALNAVLMLHQTRKEGRVTSKILCIGAMEKPDGSESLHKLREHEIPGALLDGEWSIEIHRARLRVTSPDKRVYMGYIPADGEAMSDLDIVCLHQEIDLSRLSISIEPRPEPLSDDDQAIVARARELNSRAVARYQEGNPKEAIPHAEESLKLYRQVFGSRNAAISLCSSSSVSPLMCRRLRAMSLWGAANSTIGSPSLPRFAGVSVRIARFASSAE